MYKSTYMTHGMLFSHSFPTVTLAKDEVRLPVPHFEAYFVTYRISALLSSLLSEKVLKSWFACRGNCIEIQLPRVVYTKLQSGYWSRMDDKRLYCSDVDFPIKCNLGVWSAFISFNYGLALHWAANYLHKPRLLVSLALENDTSLNKLDAV